MSFELERFHRPEEIQGEVMLGMAREVTPRHTQILDFVDVITHDEEKTEIEIWTQQQDRRSPIVGFTARTPRNRRLETASELVEPYHIKDAWPFDIKDEHLQLASDGREASIRGDGVALAVDRLENSRTATMVDAVLTMLNEQQFAYVDEADDKQIVIPYGDWILTLDPPGTALDQAAANPYREVMLMKNQFNEQFGQMPDTALISLQTAAELVDDDQLRLLFEAQQPSDPDETEQLMTMFTFSGLTWVVLNRQYETDEGLSGPIDEGQAIVFPRTLSTDGRSPIRLHKFATKLNGENPDDPRYDAIQDSVDPPEVSVQLYDNMLPHIGAQDAIGTWQMYTP